ncbi:MAG: HEAT repeat domain-containing protein [Alphaproteobacteria bacterium]|nr:HEAT repeat domain-containing protein [Alphaproteobacteria bacterium]
MADERKPTVTAPADEKRAHQYAREVFFNLVKFARTARLYGAEHKNSARFRDAFLSASQSYLDAFGWLEVELDGDAMNHLGRELLAQGTAGGEIAANLYVEGVRSISIQRGATEGELIRLSELLTRNWGDRSTYDEDLVAALWRAEFSHIHVDVAHRFAQEDDLALDALRADALGGRGQLATDNREAKGDSLQLRELRSLMEELRGQKVKPEELLRMKQDEAALLARLKDELDEAVPAAEEPLLEGDPAAALAEPIGELTEGTDAPFDVVALLLFELSRAAEGGQEAWELGAALARHAVDLLNRGRADDGASLVRRVLLLIDPDIIGDFAHRSPLAEGYGRALLGTTVRPRLVGALARAPDPEALKGPLFTLLSPVPAEMQADVIALGGGLVHGALRQVAGDWLAMHLLFDEAALIRKTEAAEGLGAVAPLLALSRLKAPQSIGACMARIQDPEANVREAALRALRGHQSPGIKNAVLNALADPSAEVRVEALRHLAVYRDAGHLQAMEARMSDPSFAEVEPTELRAWVLSYAIVGRGNALALLKQIALGAVSLPGNHPDLPALAVEGIGRTGSQARERTLADIVRRAPKLADAARRARGGAS